MATTQNTYTGNGSTVLFSFTFPYLATSDIVVSVNGVTTTAYTLANATTIQFATAPANGASIRIYRSTSDVSLKANFYPGSAIRAQDLNDNFTQNLYVTQEANNVSASANTTSVAAASTANTALSQASAAANTANTASSAAASAVTTSNSASAAASASVTTANSANAKADSALNAVASAVTYTPVTNVAGIPSGPVNNTYIEVFDSTGVESFTPLAGKPAGFIGGSGLAVRLRYTTSPATWNWMSYYATDSETRYLKLAGGTLTGPIGVSTGTAAAPSLYVSGDTNTGIYSPAADTLAFTEGGIEAMRIDSSGRLLVGASTARSSFFNTNIYSPFAQFESANNSNPGRFISLVHGEAAPSGPILILGKHRSNSVGGYTVVQSDDEAGQISFQAADGTEFVEVAGISAHVDNIPGANDMPGRLVFSTTADGAASPTERLRIDSSGRVGIGTTSPDPNYRLTVNGGGTVINTSAGTSAVLTLNETSIGAAQILAGSGNSLVFKTFAGGSSFTEQMRIDSGGNIMFTATALGQVGLTAYAPGLTTRLYWNRSATASSSTALEFADGGSTKGSISYTNTATTYATSSDYRLKENVEPITGAAARILQLKPRRFNFIVDPDHTVDGFLAHEAQAVVPECVTGTKDAVDEDGNPVYQGIDQSKMVPLLTAALQEAIAKIETLEARLTAAGIE